MESTSLQTDSAQRAKLEFAIWRGAFQRAHAAWADAPAELRASLLLVGQPLSRAEAWLFDCPEKMSDSEKLFIVDSVAGNSKRNGRGNVAAALLRTRLGKTVLGAGAAALAIAVHVHGAALSDMINEVALSALPNRFAATAPQPPPIVDVPTAESSPTGKSSPPAEQAVAPMPGDGHGVRRDSPSNAAAGKPLKAADAQQRLRALVSLARERIEQRDSRSALLLAVEAAHVRGPGMQGKALSDAGVTAASLIIQSLAKEIATAALPVPSTAGPSALFCDGGRIVVTAGQDRALVVHRTDTAEKSVRFTEAPFLLRGAAIDKDCGRMVLNGEDHSAEIWSLATGRRIAVMSGHEGMIRAAAFSPDGLTLITASEDASVRLWDARTGRVRAVLEGHNQEVESADFSSDGHRAVTASADKTLRIWNVAQANGSGTLSGHASTVTRAMFSPEGQHVLSTSSDGFAIVWNASTGQQIRRLHRAGTAIMTADFSADGRRIVTTTQDSQVQVWNADSGQQLFELADAEGATRRVVLSPDGQWLLSTSWDGNTWLWNATTGDLIAQMNGPDERVESAAFATGGRNAIALTMDGRLIDWPLFLSPPEAMRHALRLAGDCLSADERATFGLVPEFPAWCRRSAPSARE